jgi:hypothetical protein
VLLVNLAIDVEPAIAMALRLDAPPHGPVHTLLGAALVGATTGWLLSRGAGWLGSVLGGRYDPDGRVAMASGVAGGWLHVLLDSVMYGSLQPFAPLQGNPFHVAGSGDLLHLISALLLLPVFALVVRARAWRTVPETDRLPADRVGRLDGRARCSRRDPTSGDPRGHDPRPTRADAACRGGVSRMRADVVGRACAS